MRVLNLKNKLKKLLIVNDENKYKSWKIIITTIPLYSFPDVPDIEEHLIKTCNIKDVKRFIDEYIYKKTRKENSSIKWDNFNVSIMFKQETINIEVFINMEMEVTENELILLEAIKPNNQFTTIAISKKGETDVFTISTWVKTNKRFEILSG